MTITTIIYLNSPTTTYSLLHTYNNNHHLILLVIVNTFMPTLQYLHLLSYLIFYFSRYHMYGIVLVKHYHMEQHFKERMSLYIACGINHQILCRLNNTNNSLTISLPYNDKLIILINSIPRHNSKNKCTSHP